MNRPKSAQEPTHATAPTRLLPVLLMLGLLSVKAALAVDYFVDPAGADSNQGTSSGAPFQTIQRAVSLAQPGDTIRLAAGVYRQDVVTARSGTSTAPITITGPRQAVIQGGGNDRVIEINHSYITLDGFTVDGLAGSATSSSGYRDKLIYVLGKQVRSGCRGLRLLNLEVMNAGGECIRLRYFAQDNEIAHNSIRNCGVHDFRFNAGGKNGEAIYIGTAPEQLADGKNPTTDPDLSNGNRIHDNVMDTQGNECVDIKEAASGNIVESNSCTGQKDPNSGGMDSRGSGNVFRSNVIFGNLGAGVRLGGDTSTDGVDNDIYGNEIRDNAAGGIKFQRTPQRTICGNLMSNNTGGNSVGTYGSQYSPTQACSPSDTTPPSVSVTAPSSGTTLTGTIAIAATASDNVGVAGVRFRIDGANLGAEDTSAPWGISWSTAAFANGPHSITAVARDAAGNTTTSAAVSVTVGNVDTVAPAVSVTSPAGGATLAGAVTMAATASDNVGVAGVQFRVDGANVGSEDTTSPYSVSWNSGTVADGPHTVTAVARDAAGNTTTSAAVSVTVDNVDTVAPAVSVTSPAGGATLAGAVTMAATAADNVGVAGVQFRVDGANVGSEDTTSPYSISWNSATVPDGPHAVTAVARDAAGNTTTSAAVSVTVGNTDNVAPTATMSAPAAGATLRGSVTLTATASDNVGLAGVQFRVDGANVGSEDTTSPYSISWNSATVPDGPHAVTAVARDAAGNTTTSAAVGVSVDNVDTVAPVVSLTSPADAATVSGPVTLAATATDDRAVVGVQFRVDGVNVGTEDTSSPYSRSWDTLTAVNGTRVVTAVARDAAGNTTTSVGRSVTVSNTDTTAPTVSITSPASGATVSGTVTVTASATDSVGVAGVQFRVDGVNVGTDDTSAPYSVSWNAGASGSGSHTLTAIARDAAGNTRTSAAVTVSVSSSDVTPPPAPKNVKAHGKGKGKSPN